MPYLLSPSDQSYQPEGYIGQPWAPGLARTPVCIGVKTPFQVAFLLLEPCTGLYADGSWCKHLGEANLLFYYKNGLFIAIVIHVTKGSKFKSNIKLGTDKSSLSCTKISRRLKIFCRFIEINMKISASIQSRIKRIKRPVNRNNSVQSLLHSASLGWNDDHTDMCFILPSAHQQCIAQLLLQLMKMPAAKT